MSSIRFEVDISPDGWRVTSADLPGWTQRALNPTHLGILVREAHKRIAHRTAYLERLNLELAPLSRADTCFTCGDVFVQQRRTGAPLLSCEKCRAIPMRERPRRRLGHLRLVN